MRDARHRVKRVLQLGRHPCDNLPSRDPVLDQLITLAGPEIDQVGLARGAGSGAHWSGQVVDLWVRHGRPGAVAFHEAVDDASGPLAAKGTCKSGSAGRAKPVAMGRRGALLEGVQKCTPDLG